MIVQAPCKDCADRKLGCHSTCEKFKTYEKQRDAEKILIREQRNYGAEHTGYLRDRKIQRERSHR